MSEQSMGSCTTRVSYSPAPAAGPNHHLFAVEPGTPLDIAIPTASAMLGAALETLLGVAVELPRASETAQIWAAIYTIETARALVAACEIEAPGADRSAP